MAHNSTNLDRSGFALDRNVVYPLDRLSEMQAAGEIDLIALDDSALVFIEVRRRGPRSYSPAAMTVDRRKQQKLIRAAALFTAKRPRYGLCVMRFDVVAIDVNERGAQSIEWFRDAFRPADSQL